MSASIVTGSLAAVARGKGQGVARAFVDAERIILVDCSGSMDNRDSRGGRRRIDVAREELAKLQQAHPGKLAILGFSGGVRFLPGGVVPEPESNTNLAGALQYARRLDGTGMTLVVITDGQPDSPQEALAEAQRFACRIDVVFVGHESDTEAQRFCRLLARAGGGASAQAHRLLGLSEAVTPLLTGGG